MKRPRARKPSASQASNVAAPGDVDARYGLEPLFEPGREPDRELAMPSAFQSIQCPYCGERFETLVEAGTGAATYIEDCQICCQPIEFELQVDSQGAFAGLSVRRC